MKPFRNILLIVPVLISFQMSGQFANTTFVTDTVSGCDSLRVRFTPIVIPASRWDTITGIRWEFGDGGVYLTGQPDPVVHVYDSTGLFTPRMILNNNTTITRSQFSIRVYEGPTANFSYSDTAEIGTFTYVFRNVGQADNTLEYHYRWFLQDSLDPVGFQPMLLYTFTEEQSYYLKLAVNTGVLTNNLVCYDTVVRVVDVKDTLDIPNVFSPNDDNINDNWIVKSNGRTTYSLRIFTRTGTLIYQVEAPIIIWDGRNQSGQEMAADTYFYIIEPVRLPTRFRRTGYIQLYR
jgi:gliding motility-associated-like protein